MKLSFARSSLHFLAAFVLAASASAQSAQLIHQYSFNGNMDDSVGNANGSLVGSASISNGRLVLPGSGPGVFRESYGNLPTSAVAGLQTVSFEMWFTQNNADAWRKVMALGTDSSGSDLDVSLRNGQNWGAVLIPTNIGSEIEFAYSPESVTPGTEYYAAVTIGQGVMSFYLGVPGTLLQGGTTNFTGDFSTLSITNFFLGATLPGYGDQDFNGSLSEFRIWNGVLTPEEIAQNNLNGPDIVPEPGSLTLMFFGGLALAIVGQRKFARAANLTR